MKSKPRSSQRQKPAQNASALAEALGISRQLVSAWRKKLGADAPALDDVGSWEKILAADGRSGSGSPDLRRAISEQRLRLLSAAAGREECRLERERGEAVSKTEIAGQISRACARFWFRLQQRIESELPVELVGRSSAQIHQQLTEEFWRLCDQMRQDLAELSGSNSGEPDSKLSKP